MPPNTQGPRCGTCARRQPATTASTTDGATRCPGCGTVFRCGMAAGDGGCWCAAAPNLLPVPKEASGASCLCPDCLRRQVEAQAEGPAAPAAAAGGAAGAAGSAC